MTFITIGLIVGLIMGITGAGGALVSIPLFIWLLNSSLKEATVLSLSAVILGSFFNLLSQEEKIDKKIVFSLIFFGGIANFISLPLKEIAPDLFVALLLTLIGSYSLWAVWRKSQDKTTHHQESSLWKLALTGLLLGFITTLTGLGGGILLIPVLIQVFGKKYNEALPTSLTTILLISSVSFFLQLKTGLKLVSIYELILLSLGSGVAFMLLKKIFVLLKKEQIDFSRKIIFSLVVIYSISTILMKSLEG